MIERPCGRCADDECKTFGSEVEFGGHKFVMDHAEVAGINAVMSVITTLAGLMCQGVKSDFIVKVAIGVLSKILPAGDPHVTCPLYKTLNTINAILSGDHQIRCDCTTGAYVVVPIGSVGSQGPIVDVGNGDLVETPPATSPPENGGGIFDEENIK